ncbi:MAG: hypothetical protein GX896_00975 [Clostridiales bacterium]|nr:hypothetical protein [Clostridiales bacterium]
MLKKIKSKYLKALIILFIIAVFALVGTTIVWFIYYNKCYKPAINNLGDFSSYSSDGMTYYSYDDPETFNGYYCQVPLFLWFQGDYQAITSTKTLEDGSYVTDYTFQVTYTPHLISSKSCAMFIVSDYTKAKPAEISEIDGETMIEFNSEGVVTYAFLVNTDLEFISGDKTSYRKFYDECLELYESCKEIYGEEVFR